MQLRELIKLFRDEWIDVTALKTLAATAGRSIEVTRPLIQSLHNPKLLLAWDSMPLWSIRGIGPRRAMDLWQQGVRPGNLVRHLTKLPDVTRLALEHPVLDRIPRAVVESAFAKFVPPGYKTKCQLVGSYRRGRPTSGDLDILYRCRTAADAPADFDRFIQRVSEHLGAKWIPVATGPSKASGIFMVSPRTAVEVDIWIATPDNWAAMLLYATGSKQHNVRMRFVAKHRGYKLNQYGLWDAAGRPVPAHTEREIFDRLGMKWRAPEDRE